MESNKPIEDKEFDKLLNDLFLQENSGMDNSAAKFVLSQDYDVKIDPRKEKELLEKLNTSSGGRWNYWAFTSIVLFLVIAGFVYFKFFHARQTSTIQGDKVASAIAETEQTSGQLIEPGSSSAVNIDNRNNYNKPVENTEQFTSLSQQVKNENATPSVPERDYHKANESNRTIPAEKWKSYKAEKNKMLERLINIDKGLYSSVEEGKISYRGEEVILDPFILRNQTITNLEYKIFLADLIKNNKTEDYEKAMVKSEVWNNYAHPTLAALYFSDDKYNNFPVVNISTDGAILFCQWLETEINNYLQQHKSKSKIKIRLPFDSEWIFATKRGYVHFPECDGYNTVYDRTEGIVDAHYLKWTDQIKKRDKKTPHELDAPYGTNRYGMTEKQVLQLFEQSEKATSKLVSDSVYPFKIDVYNKVAHVSEIIYTQGSTSTTVIGSCWKSKKEYMQMLGEFNKAAASPYVGFRIVVLNGNKASYKAPFW